MTASSRDSLCVRREETMLLLPWMSWLSPWGNATGEAGNTPEEVKVFGDKFSLVLQVARKVQNVLGDVSDAAEKFKKWVRGRVRGRVG